MDHSNVIAQIDAWLKEDATRGEEIARLKAQRDKLLEALIFAKSLLEASILWTDYVDERISPIIAQATEDKQ